MNEREIFQGALDYTELSQRQNFLDRACGGDAVLRARVEALLASHVATSRFLNVPAPDQLRAPVPGAHTRTFDSDRGDLAGALDDADEPQEDAPDTSFLGAPSSASTIGTLGHYEIHRLLGRGAFGLVFEAFDRKLHRQVAIKVLAPMLAATSPPRKRFLREARSAAAVKHENVVQVYAVEEQPLPYLVMEFVSGPTLKDRLDGTGPLELPEILHLGRQMAAGLASAHEKGLIHRDIKPANILIESGADVRVKITDFGLARAADDASLTRSGVISGTPMYMAPEQAQGLPLDHRADLFSLGSVLYQMAGGRPPFRAPTTMAVLKRVVEEEPRPLPVIIPTVPEWLCAIISKLHAKRPEDRFQSAREVADLFARCQTDLERHGRVQLPTDLLPFMPRPLATKAETTPTSGTTPSKTAPRRRWVAATAVLLALFAGLCVTEATGASNLRGTVIRLFSPEGTLVVEVDDPSVSVSIDGEEIIITGTGAKELRLKPGQYKVIANKDGKLVLQELVTITKNGRQVVKVSREPTHDGEPPGSTASGKSMDRLSLQITPPPPNVDRLAEIPPLEKMDPDFTHVWDITSMKARDENAAYRGFRVMRNDQKSLLFAAPDLKFCHEYVMLAQESSVTWTLPPNTRSFTAIVLYLGGSHVNFTVSFDDKPHFETGLTRLHRIGLKVPEGCRTISLSVGHSSNSSYSEGLPAFWLVPRFRTRPLSEVHDFLEGDGATKVAMLKPERGEPKIARDGSRAPEPDELRHTPPYYTHLPICRDHLNAHANSTATYDIPFGAKRFRAVAYAYLSRSVRFLVNIDGKEVFRSPILGIMPVDVLIPEGAKEITLLTDDCGDQFADWADWCYPRFVGKATDPDRRAGEYMLSLPKSVHGIKVQVNDVDNWLHNVKDLPAQPFRLTAFEFSWGTKLNDAGMENFRGCKHLKAIALSGTQVTNKGLEVFDNCRELKRLIILDSPIDDAGLELFRNRAHQVTDLCLRLGVTDAGMAIFQGSKNLDNLSLAFTQVTDKGLSYFKENKTLKALTLASHAGITDLGMANFAGCNDLEHLNVASTKVSDSGLAYFKECKKLKRIEISGLSGVTDKGLGYFKDSPDIWHVNLSGTQVTDAGLAHVKNWKRLSELKLENTAITGVGLIHLKDCKDLQWLNLNGSGVTDAGIESLAKCSNLRWINLGKTKVTAEGAKKLAAALPKCGIEWDGGGVQPGGSADDMLTASQRKALEWVLSVGGTLELSAAGKTVIVKVLDQLPAGPFTLDSLVLPAVKGMDDTAIENILSLPRVTTSISLYGTRVGDAGLAKIAGCPQFTSITSLTLNFTQITDTGLESLKNFKNLAHLGLEGTRVTAKGIAHLRGLPLRTIYFRGCTEIKDDAAPILNEITTLEDFHPHGTSISDAGLKQLGGLQNLTTMFVYGVRVTDAGIDGIVKLRSIKWLSFENTRIGNEGLAKLKLLPALENLMLHGNTNVTDAGLAHLKDCSGLIQLTITDGGPNVTDVGLAHLSKCKTLRHLVLSKNKVTEDGVKQLATALPQCHIESDHGTFKPGSK